MNLLQLHKSLTITDVCIQAFCSYMGIVTEILYALNKEMLEQHFKQSPTVLDSSI